MFSSKFLEVIEKKPLHSEKWLEVPPFCNWPKMKLMELLFVNKKHYGHMIAILLSTIDFIIKWFCVWFQQGGVNATQHVHLWPYCMKSLPKNAISRLDNISGLNYEILKS